MGPTPVPSNPASSVHSYTPCPRVMEHYLGMEREEQGRPSPEEEERMEQEHPLADLRALERMVEPKRTRLEELTENVMRSEAAAPSSETGIASAREMRDSPWLEDVIAEPVTTRTPRSGLFAGFSQPALHGVIEDALQLRDLEECGLLQ